MKDPHTQLGNANPKTGAVPINAEGKKYFGTATKVLSSDGAQYRISSVVDFRDEFGSPVKSIRTEGVGRPEAAPATYGLGEEHPHLFGLTKVQSNRVGSAMAALAGLAAIFLL